ncbi:putative Teichoic-acid-transporting ATPase [Candidatus Filomicrobium marinum]|uniref:Putative Teichoic-acid-transporting ATPase n=1 Tax=Candidatus Filomicrobium marinum TaxID=1608628 RepID=A0A0D6JG96_9HYPH|nr:MULTISPECIES: ABC transporter ATP-binding protein [Filomicrobium]MCV0370083.1 ABC transporter ATP-binding protein [Filomicrobium sp.]CFX26602.1 putative Teichoic-acid-transporting ATPase [Candidatus Filomicrobium marinum]CPR19467.1 putative Teichoic-acid-transporting ATPase [Candidatus Filomicrobium marinum]
MRGGKPKKEEVTSGRPRELSANDIAQGLAVRVTRMGVKLPLGRGASRLWGRRHWALRDINFEVQRGEAIGVLGNNGSGKSSLLRAIAGIISPDEGEIGVAPDLSAAILSPGAGFQPHLTGRENVYNSSLYQGHLPKTVVSKFQEIVEFAGIGAWVDQPVATYSAGMRLRLGFSLALHLPPDVLMIDETLSAGDTAFRARAKELIEQLISSERTVLIVSHNADTLRGLCTKGVVLDRGRQIAVCDISEAIETSQSISLQRETPSLAIRGGCSQASKVTQELLALQKQLGALQTKAMMQAQAVRESTEGYVAALEEVIQFEKKRTERGRDVAPPSSGVAHATQTDEKVYRKLHDTKAQRREALAEEQRLDMQLADLREHLAGLQGQLKGL